MEIELYLYDEDNLSSKNNLLASFIKEYKYKNTESAYSELYRELVLPSDTEWFPELTRPSATLLCTEIVDEIISRIRSAGSLERTTEKLTAWISSLMKCSCLAFST